MLRPFPPEVDQEVKLYSLSSDKIVSLSPGSITRSPLIEGNRVAWVSQSGPNRVINHYNLETSTRSASYNMSEPVTTWGLVNQNGVVYSIAHNSGQDLYITFLAH